MALAKSSRRKSTLTAANARSSLTLMRVLVTVPPSASARALTSSTVPMGSVRSQGTGTNRGRRSPSPLALCCLHLRHQ